MIFKLHLNAGPPNIPKIQLSHRGDPKEGANITILCSSEDGSAELTLYKQSTASGAFNKQAVLLNIPSVQITGRGIYICEAKNDFGTERSTINITVEGEFGTFLEISLSKCLCMGSHFAPVLFEYV